jgi:hypothetical protein
MVVEVVVVVREVLLTLEVVEVVVLQVLVVLVLQRVVMVAHLVLELQQPHFRVKVLRVRSLLMEEVRSMVVEVVRDKRVLPQQIRLVVEVLYMVVVRVA